MIDHLGTSLDIRRVEDFNAYGAELLQAAKQQLEKTGQVEPLAFIVMEREVGIVPLAPLFSELGKSGAYDFLHTVAMTVKARAVATVMDMWIKREAKLPDYDKLSRAEQRQRMTREPGSFRFDHDYEGLGVVVVERYMEAKFHTAPYERVGNTIQWQPESVTVPGLSAIRPWWEEHAAV